MTVTASILPTPISRLRAALLGLRGRLSPAPFAARHMLWYVNEARLKGGTFVLPQDLMLDGVAAWRATDMAARGYLSHDIPGFPGQVFAALGAVGYRYASAGEILAWTDAAGLDAQEQWATAAFLASPEHREIALGRWDRFGAGIAGANDGRMYCAVLFSRATP